MTVSKEVKMAVDEIHRERNALAAAAKANELQESQIADLKSQIAAASSLSDEDRQALFDAVNDVQETNSELAAAVPANVDGALTVDDRLQPVPPPNDPEAPRPDPIAGTGQNGSVPLMPNSAFDPGAGNAAGAADPGQPNQSAAIETAGGFVLAGGGSVQRDLPDVHPSSEAGVAAAAAEEPIDPATLESQGSGKPPASPAG